MELVKIQNSAIYRFFIYVFFLTYLFQPMQGKTYSKEELKKYKERVNVMFQHGYDNYINNAYPYDELRPLSCDGVDTWGSFSLSLIDALDTLVVLKNYSEFKNVVHKVLEIADFNLNINVSVFETNIRVVGGLLSAHLLSYKTGIDLEPGWPCKGPLLDLAENLARRLLPAFDTQTGMPFGTVNLKFGVPPGETPVTCTAGISTFTVEFGTLSRLTGDAIFEKTALRAINALWETRSKIGLLGNHINVQDGKWTAVDAGIGAGVDSYFEYLVKGSVLLQKPKLMKMFNTYKDLINKHMKRDDWFVWVSMSSGHVTMPIFQSLESFWPGLLTLVGDISQAQATLYNYHQVLRQYGFPPESYDIAHGRANSKREGNPLRPELIESIMYMYQATKDPFLIQMGVDILEAIEHSAKTNCGYATVKNVRDHKVEDRMESFFLAETVKYLYLLFDTDSFIHNNGCCGEVINMGQNESCVIGSGGYVFNTEAHPIDIAALQCCHVRGKKSQEQFIADLKSSLNIYTLLDLVPDNTNTAQYAGRLANKRGSLVFGGFKDLTDNESDIEDDDDDDFNTDEESLFETDSKKVDEKTRQLSNESYELAQAEKLRSLLLKLPENGSNLPTEINYGDVFNITDYNARVAGLNPQQPPENSRDNGETNEGGVNDQDDAEPKNGCENVMTESNKAPRLFEYMSCPTQPFISRFFKMGQVISPGY